MSHVTTTPFSPSTIQSRPHPPPHALLSAGAASHISYLDKRRTSIATPTQKCFSGMSGPSISPPPPCLPLTMAFTTQTPLTSSKPNAHDNTAVMGPMTTGEPKRKHEGPKDDTAVQKKTPRADDGTAGEATISQAKRPHRGCTRIMNSPTTTRRATQRHSEPNHSARGLTIMPGHECQCLVCIQFFPPPLSSLPNDLMSHEEEIASTKTTPPPIHDARAQTARHTHELTANDRATPDSEDLGGIRGMVIQGGVGLQPFLRRNGYLLRH